MMVIGFLFAFFLIKHLSRNITSTPQVITNIALYCLIAGVIGSRAFYVIHHLDQFQRRWSSIFGIWQGGLEFYGGVIFALPVIVLYLRHNKLPIRRYLDILAIGLMLGVAFGRIGCFLNGCCFGKPTQLPWAIRFPYLSFAYRSQVNPNPERNRLERQLKLPEDEFFGYPDDDGHWVQDWKPKKNLTEEQKIEVTKGKYRCLPVHPAQLYSCANAAFWCLALYLFWRRAQKAELAGSSSRLFTKPGCTFALAFIVYGVTRFLIESLRDDNPFEYAWWAVYKGGTVSQNLSIYLAILGVVLMALFQVMKADAFGREIIDQKNRTEQNRTESSFAEHRT
jgi:phosphatidylglycerol:prolipoprotein diacylglycerol transferase